MSPPRRPTASSTVRRDHGARSPHGRKTVLDDAQSRQGVYHAASARRRPRGPWGWCKAGRPYPGGRRPEGWTYVPDRGGTSSGHPCEGRPLPSRSGTSGDFGVFRPVRSSDWTGFRRPTPSVGCRPAVWYGAGLVARSGHHAPSGTVRGPGVEARACCPLGRCDGPRGGRRQQGEKEGASSEAPTERVP